MTDTEAEGFLRAYVDECPGRLQWLANRTGLDLQPTRESLVEVWQWYADWYTRTGGEEGDAPVPMWCVPGEGRVPLPDPALALVDAIACLVGAALRNQVLSLEWARHVSDGKPPSINENEPVLAVGRAVINPRGLVYTFALHVRDAQSPDADDFAREALYGETFGRTFDLWREGAERQAAA